MKAMKTTGKLERNQRKYYDQLVKVIGEENLTEADMFMLEMAAKTYAIMKQAESEMAAEGIIQVFGNGARQVSPEWAVWRNAAKDFETYVRHFGLSPKARKDLALPEKEEKPADPLAKLRKVS